MNVWDIQNLIINRKKQKSYNSGWISSSVWGWLSTIQSVTGVGVEQQIVIWKTRSVWQLRDIQQPMSHNIKTPDSCRKYYWPSHYNEMFCSDNQGSAPSLQAEHYTLARWYTWSGKALENQQYVHCQSLQTLLNPNQIERLQNVLELPQLMDAPPTATHRAQRICC